MRFTARERISDLRKPRGHRSRGYAVPSRDLGLRATGTLLDDRNRVLERGRQNLGLGDSKLAMRLHVGPQLGGAFNFGAGEACFAHLALHRLGNPIAWRATNSCRCGRRVGCAPLDPFEKRAVIGIAGALLLREPGELLRFFESAKARDAMS
jgi:hypothetical protein